MLELNHRCQLLITAVSLVFLASCSGLSPNNPSQENRQKPGEQIRTTQASGDVDAGSDFPGALAELAQYRVVLVGEQHDRLDHHVMQLDVIEYLHSLGVPLAIGLEFFQQPFQSVLDAYVAATIDEQEMLEQTEYFERWVYDYRLYAPILRFAREYGIPLIALNLPGEITRKTARQGLASLSQEESRYVPKDIDHTLEGYKERIQSSFMAHDGIDELGMLENFINAQLLWDEGMAEKAADYLLEQPERLLIILAGAGHIEYRTGIPKRLERRISSPVATVLPIATNERLDPQRADYQIVSSEMTLPAKGLMGILLDKSEGGIFVQSLTPDSAAEKAGLLSGDFLRSINASTIRSFADIKLALWNANPGETIDLTVERRVANARVVMKYQITLH